MPKTPVSRATETGGGDPQWKPVAGGQIVDQIVDQMRAAIFAGMQPGDRIGTELELAEGFGVSRPTMRVAVRTLRTFGLVEVRVGNGGGLWVAHVDARRLGEALAVQIHQLGVDWEEMTEAMTSLEPALAALAAVRRSDEHLRLMRSLLVEHRSVAADRQAFHKSTNDFHLVIADAAGNKALLVAAQAFRLNQENLYPASELTAIAEVVICDHEALLRAIEDGDSDLAAKTMEIHDRQAAAPRPPVPARRARRS